jgi:hypothetical protein
MEEGISAITVELRNRGDNAHSSHIGDSYTTNVLLGPTVTVGGEAVHGGKPGPVAMRLLTNAELISDATMLTSSLELPQALHRLGPRSLDAVQACSGPVIVFGGWRCGDLAWHSAFSPLQ